ncbi:unnamed protein product [Effrenium voratum]|nr:unnamed protein product [Effrenium voratum]
MVGTVNNFDAAKGFGFICAPNFPADVYFKGESEVCMPGQEVVFILQYTQDGKPQAREVSPPMQAGELFSGIVRRYNAKNGYGFLHVEGRPQDVYFQRKDLPPDIQEQPLEGAQFQFTVATVGGKVQAQDLEWLAMPPAKRPGEMAPEPPAKRPRPTMSQGGTIRVQRPASAPAPAGDRLMGMVKSFNPQKGFGFIGSPALPGDAYFSAKSLPEAFRAMPLNNRQVSFTPFQTADGKLQAQSIQETPDSWWSFGVLVYEMLAGRSPFNDADENQVLSLVLAGRVSYPVNFSKESKDFVARLLTKSPTRRLGAPEIADSWTIKGHAFFKPLNWTDVESGNLTPPFVPQLTNPMDNFTQIEDSEQVTGEPPSCEAFGNWDQCVDFSAEGKALAAELEQKRRDAKEEEARKLQEEDEARRKRMEGEETTAKEVDVDVTPVTVKPSKGSCCEVQ